MINLMSGEIDPVDEFINYWNTRIEEIKITSIPPERKHVYLKEFFNSRISFEQSSGYENNKYLNSGYNVLFDKLNRLDTSVSLAVEMGITKYLNEEKKHQIDALNAKKGLFENAKVTLLKIKGKRF